MKIDTVVEKGKTKTIYKANDGTIFDKHIDCDSYEQELKVKKIYEENPLPNINFDDFCEYVNFNEDFVLDVIKNNYGKKKIKFLRNSNIENSSSVICIGNSKSDYLELDNDAIDKLLDVLNSKIGNTLKKQIIVEKGLKNESSSKRNR